MEKITVASLERQVADARLSFDGAVHRTARPDIQRYMFKQSSGSHLFPNAGDVPSIDMAYWRGTFKWELTEEERLEYAEKIDAAVTGHKSLREMVWARGTGAFHVTVIAPGGCHHLLPSVPSKLASLMLHDLICEELHKRWKTGAYRYLWAEPGTEHERFHTSASLRERVRRLDPRFMAFVKEIMTSVDFSFHINVPDPAWKHPCPEVRRLNEAIENGQLYVLLHTRGRPKGSVDPNGRLNGTKVKKIADKIQKELDRAHGHIAELQKDVIDLNKSTETAQAKCATLEGELEKERRYREEHEKMLDTLLDTLSKSVALVTDELNVIGRKIYGASVKGEVLPEEPLEKVREEMVKQGVTEPRSEALDPRSKFVAAPKQLKGALFA